MGLTRWSQQMTRAPFAALAMPFFPHADAIDFRAALDWASKLPGMPAFGPLQGDGNVATLAIPGGQVAFARVSTPIPASDLAYPAQAAWHWPQAREAIAAHRSHVVCHASSTELESLALHLMHSRIVAGLLATAGGSGAWVGNAALVREAGGYIRDMQEAKPDSLPLVSWIGFNAVADGDVRSMYTTGLAGFALLELELRDTRLDWDSAFRLLANVAHYELTTGVQVRDGETLGARETERRLVRHLDSTYFPGTKSAVIAA